MLIANDATVTIQLTNWDYLMTEPVVVSHPSADRIAIVGNVANYDSVRLLFVEIGGIVIQLRTHLGRLAGLDIAGPGTPADAGIQAGRGASALVEDTHVRDFGVGIYAEWGGAILADGVDIRSCSKGFDEADQTGAISANSSTSSNTIGAAYLATCGSYMDADFSVAGDGNRAFVNAYGSATSANRSEATIFIEAGYSAAHLSFIYGTFSRVSNALNSITGYRADDFSFVTARAATVSNTDRPANAEGMAFVDARDWISTNNGNAPLPARGTRHAAALTTAMPSVASGKGFASLSPPQNTKAYAPSQPCGRPTTQAARPPATTNSPASWHLRCCMNRPYRR